MTRPVVPRPRLVERIDDAVSSGGVVLVVGAAGSGKSMALAEWARGRAGTDLWIAPPRQRIDGAEIARRLVAEIDRTAPDLVADLGPCDVGDPIARRHLAEALTTLARNEPSSVLVIEDLHRVEHDAARHLGDLVDQARQAMAVVVVSRSDPPWPLVSWRLDGSLHEVRQRDLDFEGEEAIALLDLVAPGRLLGDDCDEVVRRCGGWAAALVMTALSVRDHAAPDAVTSALAAADRSIADYLFDEVLEGLDEPSRRVLIVCSICDGVDGELAAALSGVDDAAAVLQRLRRSLHLVRPMPDRPGWVRCHDVLRDLLRQELTLRGPAEVERLHRVAADWFGRQGDVHARCTHLAAVGDWPAIAATVRQGARQAFRDVTANHMVTCLELIPPHERETSVLLLLAELSSLAGLHWKVDDLLVEARSRPDATVAVRLTVDRLTCVAVEWGRPPAEVVAAADRVVAHLDDAGTTDVEQMLGLVDVDALRQASLALRGRAHDLLGRTDQAVSDLAAAHSLDGARDVVMTAFALASHSLVAARSGSPDADVLARRALALADDMGLVDHPVVATAHVALAIVALETGRPSACDEHLDRCRVACRRNNRWVTRTEELVWWAERLRRAGDLDGVKRRFDDLALLPQPPPALESDIAALRARVLLDDDRIGDASAVVADVPIETLAVAATRRIIAAASRRGAVDELTARELDVLRHLVGHLTSAEIAEQLVVSVHTVKTHQRHIYQKLGVSTRRDSIDVAVARGLLAR